MFTSTVLADNVPFTSTAPAIVIPLVTFNAEESSELKLSTCNVSLIWIALESSELICEPLILIAPATTLPVPAADSTKSSVVLVAAISFSVTLMLSITTPPVPFGVSVISPLVVREVIVDALMFKPLSI